MMDFIKQNVVPFIFNTETLAQKANIAVGEKFMRLTFRFVNNSVNSNTDTNSIFKGQHNIYKLENQIYRPDNYFEIQSKLLQIDDLNLTYSASGDAAATFDGLGGYEIYIDKDSEKAMI